VKRRKLHRRYGRSASQKWIVLLNGKIVDAFYLPVGLQDVRRRVERSNVWYVHEAGTLDVRRAA
jgi:hypothetical protein